MRRRAAVTSPLEKEVSQGRRLTPSIALRSSLFSARRTGPRQVSRGQNGASSSPHAAPCHLYRNQEKGVPTPLPDSSTPASVQQSHSDTNCPESAHTPQARASAPRSCARCTDHSQWGPQGTGTLLANRKTELPSPLQVHHPPSTPTQKLCETHCPKDFI